MPPTSKLKIALCHDWVNTYSGSEQVASRIAELLDIEDIYVFSARPDLTERFFPGRRVHVSRLGRGRVGREHWQWMLPIMPYAWSRLDLSGYDLVITSSHAAVNAVRTSPPTLRLSYCYTPMRIAWMWRRELGRFPRVTRPFWPLAAALLRSADRRWSSRVDRYIGISDAVAERIRRCYGREADVVYPPTDTSWWKPAEDPAAERGDAFLWVGRLVAYKRADVAVAAANELGARLIVAGSGPELPALRAMAGPTVEFIEDPDNDRVRELYRNARALVFPGEEDFGIVPVEAQACGTPVIAFRGGGALDTVIHGETGVLVDEPTPEAFAAAMRSFDPADYEVEAMGASAARFSPERFDRELLEVIGALLRDSGRAAAAEDLDRGQQHDLDVERE